MSSRTFRPFRGLSDKQMIQALTDLYNTLNQHAVVVNQIGANVRELHKRLQAIEAGAPVGAERVATATDIVFAAPTPDIDPTA